MKKILTTEQKKSIEYNYLTTPVKRLAKEIGVSGTFLRNYLKINNMVIPRHIIEQRKKIGRFKKGHKPFNKGKNPKDYYSEESLRAMAKTQFKKGHRPHNAKPVGSKRVVEDVYIEIKIAEPDQWQLLSRFTYEQHYKVKLTTDDIITYKDGNTFNLAIENLKKISKAEHAMRNSHKVSNESIKDRLKLLKFKKLIKSKS